MPSDDEVMEYQSREPEEFEFVVQLTPESDEVQMLPPLKTAASFVPSDDEVMESQVRLVSVSFAVQLTP